MARGRERRDEENKLKLKGERGVLPSSNRMTTRNKDTNEDDRTKVNKLISEATGDIVEYVETLQVNLPFSKLVCSFINYLFPSSAKIRIRY